MVSMEQSSSTKHSQRDKQGCNLNKKFNNITNNNNKSNFNLSSRTDKRYVYSIDAYILKKLSSYAPRVEEKSSDQSHIRDLELADPHYNSNTPVELILGADVYVVIFQDRTIPGSVNTPGAQRTTLG